MDILFTLPYKNPNNCKLDELKETCTHLGICYEMCDHLGRPCPIKKIDLICLISDYWWKVPFAYKRIQINFHNKLYYVALINNNYKSFIKTYDDMYREVYKLTCNTRKSFTIRYCKSNKEWTMETRFKVKSDYSIDLTIKPEYLDRLRNVILYLELQHIYINFYNQNLILKDVFIYMIHIYKQFFSLPSECYIII